MKSNQESLMANTISNKTIFLTTVGAGLAVIALAYEWYIPGAVIVLITAAYLGRQLSEDDSE